MRSRRLMLVAVAALLACPAGPVPAQQAPYSSTPTPAAPVPTPTGPTAATTWTGPSLRLGALVPLSGAGAWFGAEIKQGLELAAAELKPPPPKNLALTDGYPEAPAPPDEREPKATAQEAKLAVSEAPSAAAETKPVAPETRPAASEAPPGAAASGAETRPATPGSGTGTESTTPGASKPAGGRPRAQAIEPEDRPRTLALVVQAVDVQPADVKDAEVEASRLLGAGVAAIVTASPTPTLTAIPLAAGRNVLVLHAGLATERFPASSRTLIHLRPSAAFRAEVLCAHAWERGIRRLAVIAGGDPFGRAIRTTVAARWRQQGGQLAHEESVSLDASDLRSRLRALARTAPEALVLGFQGTALGEAARAVRDAGYAGQLLGLDDDRAALLAGGQALDGALVLADAFVPLPGTRGARFARAYESRHGQPPSRFAASAYEVATLLTDVGQRSLQGGRGLGGNRLREALGSGPFPSLYAGELVVRDDGTIARPLALFHVDGGRLRFDTYVAQDGRAVGAS